VGGAEEGWLGASVAGAGVVAGVARGGAELPPVEFAGELEGSEVVDEAVGGEAELAADVADDVPELAVEVPDEAVEPDVDVEDDVAEPAAEFTGDVAELTVEATGEVAELTVEATGDVAEPSVDVVPEIVEVSVALRGVRAAVAAWAGRENSSMITKTAAVASAACTATRAIRRAVGCMSSSHSTTDQAARLPSGGGANLAHTELLFGHHRTV
jgi:hypothetical protein